MNEVSCQGCRNHHEETECPYCGASEVRACPWNEWRFLDTNDIRSGHYVPLPDCPFVRLAAAQKEIEELRKIVAQTHVKCNAVGGYFCDLCHNATDKDDKWNCDELYPTDTSWHADDCLLKENGGA